MNTIEKNAAGHKIVIVGATSGIGLAVAEKLAAAGNTLGLAGRNLATVKTLAERYPERVFLERIDISSEDAPESLSHLIGQMGGMDVYFHVAGVGYSNPELEAAPDGATVEVNVAGFTRMIDAAFRYFTASGGGHIAAITSVAGTKGIGPMAAYCASKSYQRIYLEAVAQLAHARNLNVTVSDMRPGWVSTPLVGEGAPHPMMMPVDYGARRIAAAMWRPGVHIVDWRWRCLVGLWRLVPRWLWVRMNPAAFGGGGSKNMCEKSGFRKL